MVIKSKDDLTPQITALEELLSRSDLSQGQRENIKEEISRMRKGVQGEANAAYHIDFNYGKGSNNFVVIHDLRIEHNGDVAQIDHLLIGRMLDVWVIESKNFSSEIQMLENGEFQVRTSRGWVGMESPVEQNNRHITVLRSLIRDQGLAPVRLGVSIPLNFHNVVLVSPRCRITKRCPGATIVKMDLFRKHMDEMVDKEGAISTLLSVGKIVSLQTLEALAGQLVARHRPAKHEIVAKFGISDRGVAVPAEPLSAPKNPATGSPAAEPRPEERPRPSKCCDNCQTTVDSKTVAFCRFNSARFNKRILCRTCQGTSPQQAAEPLPAKEGKGTVQCASCSTPVDSKVIHFCRIKSRQFGGRILCRECQAAA